MTVETRSKTTRFLQPLGTTPIYYTNLRVMETFSKKDVRTKYASKKDFLKYLENTINNSMREY